MTTTPTSTTPIPAAPAGSATVDPIIWTDDAPELVEFICDVFGGSEVTEARTLDTDGLVLHSEVRLGDSTLTVADRKPAMAYTPAFVRVYVDDPTATLDRAVEHGGRIVTEPTDFFGDVLARMADPYGHLWWVYRHDPTAAAWDDTAGDDQHDGNAEESWESFTTPELAYINSSLIDGLASLRDPRTV